MGYQNGQRPDYFDDRETLRLSGIDKPDEEIYQDYLRWLLTDCQTDLTDLIEDIRRAKSPEELIEAIRFIKGTLLQYEKEVYPSSLDEE
jgi:hypothetical protein